MAKVLKSNEFRNEAKDGVVIVDFFAEWCGPCKMLAPVFEELGSEMKGKAKFIKINVDNSGDIANAFNVVNIPTMVILKDGELKETMIGFKPKNSIRESLEKYI